jgi:hypothetical protein
MKDKQIDNIGQMARVMCGRDKDCLVCPIQSPCLMRNCAELLNAEGYREASDVVAEIEKYILEGATTIESKNSDALYGAKFAIEKVVLPILEAFKKKYTEDGE